MAGEAKRNTAHNADNHPDRFYFPELDGLRFLAFFLVFIRHSELFSDIPYLSILCNNGWIGVDLFFVLSAFLFTRLLLSEHQKTKTISFKKFYIRRIFRIWPIYFLLIAFSVAVFVFSFHQEVTREILTRILGLLTFSDNIFTSMYGYNVLPFIPHLWTIGYEEQFYLFIPLIILLLARSSVRQRILFLAVLLIVFNLLRIFLISAHSFPTMIFVLPVTHFESIFLGIILGFGGADFLLKKINPVLLGLLGFVFFLLISILPPIEHTSYWLIATYTFAGLSASLVFYAVVNSNFLKVFFSHKTLVFLGKRSYGLYVYHLFGIALANNAIKNFPGIPSNHLAIFLYSLFITVLISILSYKFIETPFLKWKKKFEVIASRPV